MSIERKLRTVIGYITFSGYAEIDREVRDLFERYVDGKKRKKTSKAISKMFHSLPSEVPAELRFWRINRKRYMGAVFLHATIPWFRSVGNSFKHLRFKSTRTKDKVQKPLDKRFKCADAVRVALNAFIDGQDIPEFLIVGFDVTYGWDNMTKRWLTILHKVREMTDSEFGNLTGCSMNLA